MKEKLFIIRNIFFTSFIVGLFFLVIAALIYLPCQCAISGYYSKTFNISIESYNNMWVSFVGLIKTILIFLFLVPSIAIHIVARRQKD